MKNQPACGHKHRAVTIEEAADSIYYWYNYETIHGQATTHTYLFGYFFTKAQQQRWHIAPLDVIKESLRKVEVDCCSFCMPLEKSHIFPQDGHMYYLIRVTSKLSSWQMQIRMPMPRESLAPAKNELQAFLQEISGDEDVDPNDWKFDE